MEYEDLIDECERIIFSSYENFCAWYAEYEGIISTASKMRIRIRDHQGVIIYDSPLDVFHAHEEGDNKIVMRASEKLGFFKGLYFAIVVCSIFWLLVGFTAYAIWGLQFQMHFSL